MRRGTISSVTSKASQADLSRRSREAKADSHDLIRVQGARVNNLKDVSVEIPKRRLTVFTGVSGSGKSSLVFGTATDANAMLRILFSRLGKPHIGSSQAFSFNVASAPGAGHDGGKIVFEGTPAQLVAKKSTLTGKHLASYVGK